MAPLPRGIVKGRMPKIRLPQIPQSAKHAAAGGKPSQNKGKSIRGFQEMDGVCGMDMKCFGMLGKNPMFECVFCGICSINQIDGGIET